MSGHPPIGQRTRVQKGFVRMDPKRAGATSLDIPRSRGLVKTLPEGLQEWFRRGEA